MAYGDFESLPRRTASDKVLHDKAFNITKNPKYDRYQRVLASIVYKFFLIKSPLYLPVNLLQVVVLNVILLKHVK